MGRNRDIYEPPMNSQHSFHHFGPPVSERIPVSKVLDVLQQ